MSFWCLLKKNYCHAQSSRQEWTSKNNLTRGRHCPSLGSCCYPSTGPQNGWKVIKANGPWKLVTFMLTLKIGHAKSCLYYALYILCQHSNNLVKSQTRHWGMATLKMPNNESSATCWWRIYCSLLRNSRGGNLLESTSTWPTHTHFNNFRGKNLIGSGYG